MPPGFRPAPRAPREIPAPSSACSLVSASGSRRPQHSCPSLLAEKQRVGGVRPPPKGGVFTSLCDPGGDFLLVIFPIRSHTIGALTVALPGTSVEPDR